MGNNLSEELQQKLKECATVEELEAVASDAGVELSHEMLQALAGGALYSDYGKEACPKWFDCNNYCQVHGTAECGAECTWVSMPMSSAELVCDTHM